MSITHLYSDNTVSEQQENSKIRQKFSFAHSHLIYKKENILFYLILYNILFKKISYCRVRIHTINHMSVYC